jgi:hypothetical protein
MDVRGKNRTNGRKKADAVVRFKGGEVGGDVFWRGDNVKK